LRDPHGLGETLFYLGYAADAMGDVPTAAAHYTAAFGSVGRCATRSTRGSSRAISAFSNGDEGSLSSAVAHVEAVLQTSVSLRDRWLLSFDAQATVVIVASRPQTAAWARLLGAAAALGQATGGATFGWEHLPGAEDVVRLREQLGSGADLSAGYREGLTLSFAKVAALALTLLGEIT
jgi:hypothetical protein